MPQLFYKMIIGPLNLYFELVYALSYNLVGLSGLTVVPMSLAVSFICLPFYRRAEAMQKEERELEKSMEKGIAHIRSTFSGDERFLMLQTYYRFKHYHPLYVLKSALPLALQVPFFISAYRFLSGLKSFIGVSFGPIADLSAPDGLLSIGGLTVNVLPILMTAINLISSTIYAKDHTRREKIQLYGVALVFLVLLYRSPSILVLYWTCNNIFSLVRNLIDHAKNRTFLKCAILSGLGGFLLVYALFTTFVVGETYVWEYLIAAAFFIPTLCEITKGRFRGFKTRLSNLKLNTGMFISGCLFLAVLTGLLIPSAVIASSPSEFVIPTDYHSPLSYLPDSLAVAIGLFLLWFGFFYYLSSERGKCILNLVVMLLCGIAVVDYLLFAGNPGTLSAYLQYEAIPFFSNHEILLNVVVLVLCSFILIFLWVKKERLVRTIVSIAVVVALGMSGFNMVNISKALAGVSPAAQAVHKTGSETQDFYTLSKDGKNVVVLMMDKAISSFVPYILKEKPELKEQFDGFTWYPNTISFGWSTNIGSPAIYGGYEYTPEEMNRRSNEWLGDKHDEALRLMPVLFDQGGYDVMLNDPPYAGYSETPDLSIYDEYPNIKTYLTNSGQFRYLMEDFEAQDDTRQRIWERNFFYYSLMKTVPLMAYNTIYQEGSYLNPNAYYDDLAYVQHMPKMSIAHGVDEKGVDNFAALKALPTITSVSESEKGSFLLLYNCIAHEPMLYQTPDYEPSIQVDNTEYDSMHKDRFSVDGQTLSITSRRQMVYYHANMAGLLQLGKWFDWMREQGVYDNTRIIIVADHGEELGCFKNLILDDGSDIMLCNPLLLVKDFDVHGFYTDSTFMTNADTPVLAFQGLIDDPVNPFTGNTVTDKKKYEGEQHILTSGSHQIAMNNGNTFMPGDWYSVNNNALSKDNWSYLGKY